MSVSISLVEMLKGGVIMDAVAAEQAKVAGAADLVSAGLIPAEDTAENA